MMKPTTTILLALSLLSSVAMAEIAPSGSQRNDASAASQSMQKTDASNTAMAPQAASADAGNVQDGNR